MKHDQILEILQKAIKMSSSDEIQALCITRREAPTRFANNQVTYEAETEQMTVLMKTYQENRIGSAQVNSIEFEKVKNAVKRADLNAKNSPGLEHAIIPLGPQEMPPDCSPELDESDFLPETRGRIVEFACQAGKKEKVDCSGYVAITRETKSIVTSKGLNAHSEGNILDCSLTARTPDGKGSGWAGAWAPHLKEIDFRSLSHKAIKTAKKTANARELKPGDYPVLLSPLVAEYLLFNWTNHLDAESIEKGLSSLAREENGKHKARLGEEVLSPLLTIQRKVCHPLVQDFRFDNDGVSSGDITYIEKGILKNIYYSLPYATKTNNSPTGTLGSLFIPGTEKKLDDLIKTIDHGVLINKIWYVRWVDPRDITVTGLTRDGTFWIENGEIQYPIKNMRFNQSIAKLFTNITSLGKTTRYWRWSFACPAMVAPSFTFSSSTDSV